MPIQDERSTGQLVGDLGEQVTRLLREEIRSAKLETVAKVRRLGTGAGLLAGAAVLAVYAAGVLVAAAVLALATVLPALASALLVAGVLLAAACLAGWLGLRRLRSAVPPIPTDAIASVTEDLATIKESAHR